MVLEPFRGFFNPLFTTLFRSGERKDIEKLSEPSKATQKPRKDDNEQLKYNLAVLFSSKFILCPHGMAGYCTCGISALVELFVSIFTEFQLS